MLFGSRKRLRHGTTIGAALGLLGAGTLGMLAGLSAWAVFWSVPGAIVGAMIHSGLTRRERRPFGIWPGVAAGAAVGIFLCAVWTGPPGVLIDAIDGTLVGAVVGVLLIPALLAWISKLPELFRSRRRAR
jgi:outer membrane lipoprotein SlyB